MPLLTANNKYILIGFFSTFGDGKTNMAKIMLVDLRVGKRRCYKLLVENLHQNRDGNDDGADGGSACMASNGNVCGNADTCKLCGKVTRNSWQMK